MSLCPGALHAPGDAARAHARAGRGADGSGLVWPYGQARHTRELGPLAPADALDSVVRMDVRAYVVVAGMVASGCNSDDTEQWVFSTTGTTEVDPTVISVFTTEEPSESTSTTAVPTPEWTCRDALECARDCALDFTMPTGFEGEWQLCFDNCFAHLTAEEWLRLFDLFECVVPLCSAMPQCMPDDGTCTACYVANLLAIEPNLPAECASQILACY